MLDAKVEHYETLGDITLARVLRCFAPVFVPRVTADDVAGGSTGVVGVKTTFRWRDDATEAAWQKTSGWSLLTLACAVDDEAAVTELLATAEGRAMLTSRGKSAKHTAKQRTTTLRLQPFSRMLLDMATGMRGAVARARDAPLGGC